MKTGMYLLLAVSCLVAAIQPSASQAVTLAAQAPTPITIPNSGVANPYPSPLVWPFGDLPSPITDVNVTLNFLNHTFPDDIDILLVGPTGANVIIMSDAGGSTPVTFVTLVLDDAAASSLPDGGPLVSGFFKPSNFAPGETFPAPAPAGPYGTALSVFNGTSPAGTWNLYVFDDAGGDIGRLELGWGLIISGDAQSVPEPITLLLLGAGLIGLASTRFRRR